MSVRHTVRTRAVGAKPGFVQLLLLLLTLVATGSASAAEITYTSMSGIWHDPVDNLPGSQPGDPVITNGIPTSIIRWGDDVRYAAKRL